jgi:methylthioxylose transferase
LLAVSGVLAASIADLSGLSKAEAERIWLSFGVIAYSSLALLRGQSARWALAASATWALLVNHLLNTGW